jgi:catechol 2,3-dioxygenase-like lactoylglutathione lyase family enzyme
VLALLRPVRYAPRVPLAFHHLAVQCSDLAAAERFYRDVLGLPVLRRWPRPEGGDRSVWLALGDGFLALERAAEPLDPGAWRDGRAGIHLFALRIRPDERTGWEARLAELGVPIAHRTRWTIYVRDPEGNRIGLSHHPHEAELP